MINEWNPVQQKAITNKETKHSQFQERQPLNAPIVSGSLVIFQ